jgi:hypothetical protein
MRDQGTWVQPSAERTSVERFEPGESRTAVRRIATVAALGGSLFGYDGAVSAIGIAAPH